MNLYNLLSEADKQTIYNYVTTYGIHETYYIGNESFLSEWAKSKTKLYHLLGNQFIYSTKFSYEKPEHILFQEMCEFKIKYADFLNKIFSIANTISHDEVWFAFYFHASTFTSNKTSKLMELTGKDKTVKIPAGTKPIKAIAKIMSYYDIQGLDNEFEEFRLEHSKILNDKKIKGTLSISIHPMDFMTMSDNDSGWSSCMNWKNHGCYFLGSEEMMNSNNVVCCYITSSTPYVFKQDCEYGEWNNKKWRTLFYVDKNIICAGKQYPYKNSSFIDTLLNTLRQLAQENMGWTYKFGPQPYLDMKTFDSDEYCELSTFDLRNEKKIVFDTQAMYNDYMNDHSLEGPCIRNPVKKSKLISLSGKTKCLCCGDNVINYNDDYIESYNDRVSNPGSLVCKNCLYTHFSCIHNCEEHDDRYTPSSLLLHVDDIGLVCPECYDRYIKVCPCCGKNIDLYYKDEIENFPLVRVANSKILYRNLELYLSEYCLMDEKQLSDMLLHTGVSPLIMCSECCKQFLENHKEDFLTMEQHPEIEKWDLTQSTLYMRNRQEYYMETLKFSLKEYTIDEILAMPESYCNLASAKTRRRK